MLSRNFETCFMHNLDSVEFQLHSDSKIIKLLQKLRDLSQLQTLRGTILKGEKIAVKVMYHSIKQSTLFVYNKAK